MTPNETYRDENWMCERVREGRSPAEIAGLCDVTQETIERWIDRHELSPYRDGEWLTRQIEQYVSEKAIAEWCGVTEQTVKRWMRKFDIDHPGLAPATVMQSFLRDRFDNPDDVPIEAQISVLWQRHQVRVQYSEIARAVGATPQKVRRVLGADSSDSIDQLIDSMEFLGSDSVPTDIANEVKARDDGECVRCGSGENIELHHIIPGETSPENLAMLCRDCHRAAHSDDFYTADLAYNSRSEFWGSWIDS